MEGVVARVVIVEDHPVVISGMIAALVDKPEVRVVGRASTLQEARQVLATTLCDVVLLDLRLPDGSGVELLGEARAEPESPAFLVLSSFMTNEYVSASIAMGASGFLLKTASTDEIVHAISAIASGSLAFTTEQLRAARTAAWLPLTEREHQVLDGVIRGRSNDELAGDLRLSRKTVEAYVSRLLARFGAATRTDLAILAERGQLLDLPVSQRRP